MKKKILCAVLAALTAVLSGCSEKPTSGESENSAQQGVTPGGQLGDELSQNILQSKVTSADATAHGILNTVNMWIADLGVKLPEEDVVITISGSGVPTVTAPGFMKNDSDTDGAEAARFLAEMLKTDFNFDKEINAVVFYSGNKAIGCAYSAEAELEFLKSSFTADNFRSGRYNWGGAENGVTGNGSVVGTSPKVAINN